MHTIVDLLDAACVAQGADSDYAIAKKLGTEPSNVYRWRGGKVRPGNESLVPLAQLIGIDPQYAIAVVEVLKIEHPTPTRTYFEQAGERHPEAVKRVNKLLEQQARELEEQARALRRRARRGAAIILIGALAVQGAPRAHASTDCAPSPDNAAKSLYIMVSNGRRHRRRRRTFRPLARAA